MKIRSHAALFGLSLFTIFAASGWVPAHFADEDKTMSAGDIRQALSDMGSTVEEKKDEEGKTYFLVKTKDSNTFLLFQYGGKGDLCTSLSASAPFNSKPDLKKMDAWNSSTRFTKAYTGTEETEILEADLDVSVAPNKAIVQKFLTMFNKAITSYKNAD